MSGSALSDLTSLMALGRERDLDMRPVLLRVQTDLFVTARHRDRATIMAFEALAVGLLAAIDDDTAAIIARKLAPVAETPESVLLLLVLRGGEARRAVIEQAPALSELMIAAASGDGGDLSVFLAARRGLAAAEVAELVAARRRRGRSRARPQPASQRLGRDARRSRRPGTPPSGARRGASRTRRPAGRASGGALSFGARGPACGDPRRRRAARKRARTWVPRRRRAGLRGARPARRGRRRPRVRHRARRDAAPRPRAALEL